MTPYAPLIERGEKLLLLGAGCYFVFKNFTPVFVTHNVVACLYMAEALLDMTFTVIRQRGPLSHNWRDWLVAVLGTYASLLVVAAPQAPPVLPSVLCGSLALIDLLRLPWNWRYPLQKQSENKTPLRPSPLWI